MLQEHTEDEASQQETLNINAKGLVGKKAVSDVRQEISEVSTKEADPLDHLVETIICARFGKPLAPIRKLDGDNSEEKHEKTPWIITSMVDDQDGNK